MKTFLGSLLLVLALCGSTSRLLAQGLPGLIAQQATQAPAAAPDTAASAKAALDVLKDDAARARLITVLEGLTQAQGTASPPAPKLGLPLAANSVGAELVSGASQTFSETLQDVLRMARAVTDFPLLWNWLNRLATDRLLQFSILNAAWPVAVVLVLWFAVDWLARRMVRRPLEALRGRAPMMPEDDPKLSGLVNAEAGQTEWLRRRASAVILAKRLPYVAGGLLLDLMPVLAVAISGGLMIRSGLIGTLTAQKVVELVLFAYLGWRAVVVLARAVAQPHEPRLRLVPASDHGARMVVRQAGRIAWVAGSGWALAEVSVLFGLYQVGHAALLKITALVVYLLVAGIVLRNRRGMATFLQAAPDSVGLVAVLRNAAASTWHRVVLFYLGALWLVWALGIPNGFYRLLQLVGAAVVVLIMARGLILLAQAGLDRLLRASNGLDDRYPGLEGRVATYHPLARALVNGVIMAAALVVLFQSWGLDSFAWFTRGALGGRLLEASASIVVTLLLALGVWEFSNAAIERHLARLARDAQLSRSARLRTLLPMLRTTLLVTVCLVAGLIVLSEIGVNIAPLLAGAGVIGLAIGFGSQKLVQDIITGLFLLLENAMQVGDVVSLGGMSGTVENLSIRTIRLRALDGSVHIVPFSAVTTVTNMTRDFGYAVVDVSVGLNEEPDHVAGVLREIAAGLRTEKEWRGVILADLDVMGVEKFTDLAWVMRIRIKTLPSSRWAVGRELNRRIKYRFDALAIESPMTSFRVLGMATPISGLDTPAIANGSPT
jgi:small-conductance mechanosensitive channel